MVDRESYGEQQQQQQQRQNSEQTDPSNELFADNTNDMSEQAPPTANDDNLSPKVVDTTTPFSVTDILTAPGIVEESYRNNPANLYMGPPSPISPGGTTGGFLAYNNYNNQNNLCSTTSVVNSVTPLNTPSSSSGGGGNSPTNNRSSSSMASYSHMSHMSQLNHQSFQSQYCGTNANGQDLASHYTDMRAASASSAAAAGWYASPATDPRFASEYCKSFLITFLFVLSL